MKITFSIFLFQLASLSYALTVTRRLQHAKRSDDGERDCGFPDINHVNATGSKWIRDPFQFSGTLNTTSRGWTWQLTTQTKGPSNTERDMVQNKLFLNIDPPLDLKSRDFPGLGCGASLTGLNFAALNRGQGDYGSCLSMLSPECIRDLKNLQFSFGQDCRWRDGSVGLPGSCSDYFSDFKPKTFVFASTNANDICETPAGQPQGPIHAWEAQPFVHNTSIRYGSGSPSLLAYEQDVTKVYPILVSVQGTEQAQLICLRSSDIAAGSIEPLNVPGEGDLPLWILAIEMAVVGILIGLALL